jgi:hypothetical protein
MVVRAAVDNRWFGSCSPPPVEGAGVGQGAIVSIRRVGLVGHQAGGHAHERPGTRPHPGERSADRTAAQAVTSSSVRKPTPRVGKGSAAPPLV